jgi:hypothetical protein
LYNLVAWTIKFLNGNKSHNNIDQQEEDNNKTIYPTPVFEEVPPCLGNQNVEGEPRAFRGKPLVCRERPVKRRRSNND